MSDDGRELERPAYKRAELVDAIVSGVPFDQPGRRQWAERIARAIEGLASSLYRVEIPLAVPYGAKGQDGKPVECRAAAPRPLDSPAVYLRSHRVLLRNRLGDEWTVDNVPPGVTSVTMKRTFPNGLSYDVQFMWDEKRSFRGMRVFVEPDVPNDPHQRSQATIEAVRTLVGATSDMHTIDAVRGALYDRDLAKLNILLTVGGAVGMTTHPMPAGSPAHAEAVFEAVRRMKTRLDAVALELRAVQWTDETGEQRRQVMGLEMAAAELGRLRTEFSAFQKTAVDSQARIATKLADATTSAQLAWTKVRERDQQLGELASGLRTMADRAMAEDYAPSRAAE